MALIPTVQASPTISATSTPSPQLADPIAIELGRLGAAAADLADAWQTAQRGRYEASFQDFVFRETQAYESASTNLAPEAASGFATAYDTEFQKRADKWRVDNLSGASPGELDNWNARLTGARARIWGAAIDRERGLQTEFVNTQLDTAISGTIIPRAQQVAALPDDAGKVTALQEVIEEAYALIDASALSPQQKAAVKEKVRLETKTAFARALPPAERQRLDPNTPDETVVDRIGAVEGRRKNPKSSAVGPGQFIDATWIDLVRRYRPDISERMTRQQILDLRTGPLADQLGPEMIRAYAAENGAFLKYNGVEATAGNLYLAHFLGPQGAFEILSAAPDTSAATINPEAAKANPAVFYHLNPDDRNQPDFTRPRSAAEVAQWAGALMAGTYHTDWSRELSDIPYEQRANIALDGAREYVAEKTATAKAVKDAYDAQLNAAKNGVLNGTFGLVDLADAYDDGNGWLTDATDRKSVMEMIEKRDKDVIDLARAQALMQDASREILWADPDEKKAVNLWYDKLAGGGEDLYESDGIGVAKLRATVERAQMVPDSAAARLKAGLWSTDAAQRERAVTIMDGLERQNPAAFQRAFTDAERMRMDVYQRLAPMVPPEVLAEEMDTMLSQSARAAHETRRTEGRKLATEYDMNRILGAFDETFWWGGEPSISGLDATAGDALRADFNDLYAEAYSRVPSQDEAFDLAVKWLGNKWGKSDIGTGTPPSDDPALIDYGDATVLMPYPPERYYPAIDGSHDWMDDQLADEVERQFPGAQSYGIIPDPHGQTEADVAGGILPSYRVVVLDKDGQYRPLGVPIISGGPDERAVEFSAEPALIRFDFRRAQLESRARFDAKRKGALIGDAISGEGQATGLPLMIPPDRTGRAAGAVAGSAIPPGPAGP